MFEIGNSLRQARERQRLSLHDVEGATRMRTRQLAALEEERFDRFPGHFYARTFLRSYAEFLGLDSRPFMDEYRERYEAVEEAAALTPRRRPRFHRPPRRAVWAAGTLAAVVAAVLLAWSSGGGGNRRPLVAAPSPRPAAPAVRHAVAQQVVPPRRRRFRIVLRATRGDCWLLVRAGSEAGPQLYEGTLAAGEKLVFARRFLWLRAGAPWNLDANGKPLPGVSGGSPVNLLVTPAGLRPA